MLAELDFSESIWLEFFSALFTALLVAGFAALIVQMYRGRIERNIKERELAGAQATKEREQLLAAEKAERDARSELIGEVSRLGASMYVRCQEHWRQDVEDDVLIGEYSQWAIDSETLENELAFRYGRESEQATTWHQIRDLLTVRYFDLRDRNTDDLRRKNSEGHGDRRHSGLDVEQLRDMKLVLSTYHRAMEELVELIRTGDISV